MPWSRRTVMLRAISLAMKIVMWGRTATFRRPSRYHDTAFSTTLAALSRSVSNSDIAWGTYASVSRQLHKYIGTCDLRGTAMVSKDADAVHHVVLVSCYAVCVLNFFSLGSVDIYAYVYALQVPVVNCGGVWLKLVTPTSLPVPVARLCYIRIYVWYMIRCPVQFHFPDRALSPPSHWKFIRERGVLSVPDAVVQGGQEPRMLLGMSNYLNAFMESVSNMCLKQKFRMPSHPNALKFVCTYSGVRLLHAYTCVNLVSLERQVFPTHIPNMCLIGICW